MENRNRALSSRLFGTAALSSVLLFTGCASDGPDRSEWPRRFGAEEGDAFRFFYATTRSRDEPLLAGADTGHAETTVGTFVAQVAPRLYVGEDSKVDGWRDRDEIEIVATTDLEHAAFIGELKAAVDASPNGSLLLFVWGWKDGFVDAAMKTAYSSYLLDIDTPVLLFDYPGDQGDGILGYKGSKKMARLSGKDLGALLATIEAEVDPEKTWIHGISMGGQVVCDAFAWMNAHPELGDAEAEIDHVVLAAPDVDEGEFTGTFRDEIAHLTRQLTVYVSSNDTALILSAWINLGRRAGQRVTNEPPLLDEMVDLLALQEEGAQGVHVVDVTPINTTRNRHHFFTDSSEYLDDLYLRLLDAPPVYSRNLYPIRYKDKVNFWILWGD